MLNLYWKSKNLTRFYNKNYEDDTVVPNAKRILSNHNDYHQTKYKWEDCTVVESEITPSNYVDLVVFDKFEYVDYLKNFIEERPYPYGLNINLKIVKINDDKYDNIYKTNIKLFFTDINLGKKVAKWLCTSSFGIVCTDIFENLIVFKVSHTEGVNGLNLIIPDLSLPVTKETPSVKVKDTPAPVVKVNISNKFRYYLHLEHILRDYDYASLEILPFKKHIIPFKEIHIFYDTKDYVLMNKIRTAIVNSPIINVSKSYSWQSFYHNIIVISIEGGLPNNKLI